MVNRRLASAAVSSDEEDDAPPPRVTTRAAAANGGGADKKRKRRTVRFKELAEEEEEAEDDPQEENSNKNNDDDEEEENDEDKRKKRRVTKHDSKDNKKKVIEEESKLKPIQEEDEEEDEDEDEEEEEDEPQDAKPTGEVIRVSGKGRGRREHYESFEYDGNSYKLEDPVLLVPEEKNQKPYVAIIKDISQTKDGNVMVTGQWFYRPEEAQKRAGGNWQSRDTRELFYSFHRDEVPAESVMHKCVVHFIPLNKQIPIRKEHPGFIVQKVYDTEQRRLFKLTDKDYEDTKQQEIDLLVQKTIARVGDLPDLETEDNTAVPVVGQEEQVKKRFLRKKSMTLDVTREDEIPTRWGQSKADTPGSCANYSSEYFKILTTFEVLTGEMQRDKWLEKLLQSIQFLSVDNVQDDGKEKGSPDVTDRKTGSAKHVNESSDNDASGDKLQWPDSFVPAVVALEKAAHEALSSDFQKYNQKMRQLAFNLKNNSILSRRLLNGQLEPSKILSMSPNELKEGLTAEEIASREPEEPEPVQMTDARCKRCSEKKVRLNEIIQAGHGDRYQLECIACGNTWYASRDEAASLTIDGPNFTKSVGTEPLATAKFEDVEKKLTSPRRTDKGASDVLKKTTEAYMPILDSQRSFNKTKPEENTTTTTGNAD